MSAIGRVVLLTGLWLLAWGEVSAANLVSGLVVASVILAVLPPSGSRSAPVRLHPMGVLRLIAYIASQLVTSNVVMTREILRRRSSRRPGVVVHRLEQPSEHVVTVMTSVIALSPGTMTVDVDRASSTIHVHFLFLHDVDAAHAAMARLERLTVGAIDPSPTTSSGG